MSDQLKTCKTCKKAKNISEFSICLRKADKIYYRADCKKCRQPLVDNANLEQYWKNPEVRRDASVQYYYDNKNEETSEKKKAYIREYRKNNPDKIRTYQKKYSKIRRQDPVYRMRINVGRSVREALSIQGSKKNWRSFWKYVNYNLEQLKFHLESLFEPWMVWSNYGTYDSKIWNDNDPTTLTWNIDHIVPQSDLPYVSMEDDNFKKCWSLQNLRPYSAKQNTIDGVNRTRHRGKI